jgi:hypothetical protein
MYGVKTYLKRAIDLKPPSRWVGPFELGLPLPPDTVLLPLPHSRSIVAASTRADLVLKASRRPAEDARGRDPDVNSYPLTNEIEALHLAEASGMGQYVPTLVTDGTVQEAGNTIHWMLTRVAPNTNPFGGWREPRRRFDPKWRHWLYSQILPVMQQFYTTSGLERVNGEEALHDTLNALQSSAPLPLKQLAALVEAALPSATSPYLVRARIHGDLIPRHVHRHQHGWRLIDWQESERTAIAWELFQFHCQPPYSSSDDHGFWAWLRGDHDLKTTPVNVRDDVDDYLTWQARWLGLDPDPRALRFTILLLLLQRMVDVMARYDFQKPLRQATESDPMASDWWEIKQLAALHLLRM